MILNHIILATLWIAYCVLHSVLASQWLKRKLRSQMKNFTWYRLWYTLFAFVFLAGLLYYQISISTVSLFNQNNFTLVAGVLLSFFGLMLMLVCIRKYFMSLSGLRSLIVENFSNELQITGVHNHVRHPLYLGTFGFIWGLFLLLPYLSLLIADVIITIYTLVGIELEEEKLMAEFGDAYAQYKARVPKLIPSLRPNEHYKTVNGKN
jgi:protein-S-isoprenylcysteine O-methyltransferase Ste14